MRGFDCRVRHVTANDVELLRHFRDTLLESNVSASPASRRTTFGPLLAAPVGESDLRKGRATR
jgi:hypothetical protein